MLAFFLSAKMAFVFLIMMVGLAEVGEGQMSSTSYLEDLVPVDCEPNYTPPNHKFGINM